MTSVGPKPSPLVKPGEKKSDNMLQNRNMLPLRERRRRFVIFLHILLKYLEETNPSLNKTVKEEIITCVKRNREGHPAFKPLIEAIEAHLIEKVGDENWLKSIGYFNQYLVTKQQLQS
mmetsp:Transcript_18160/g.24991  ORF Transcript_18160/g.24991 Transcript_18160/m.24991 type:complete len:118 (-) Transcript_18160:280-633(-)